MEVNLLIKVRMPIGVMAALDFTTNRLDANRQLENAGLCSLEV
jgi:hypothetical protein